MSEMCPKTEFGRRNRILLDLYRSREFMRLCRNNKDIHQPSSMDHLLYALRTMVLSLDWQNIGYGYLPISPIGRVSGDGLPEDGTCFVRYTSAKDGKIYKNVLEPMSNRVFVAVSRGCPNQCTVGGLKRRLSRLNLIGKSITRCNITY